MEYLILCFAALLGSALTLFSGFGLGTILLPVFSIFFPVDLAIALTAIVHFLNNIFKLVLFGRYAVKEILIKFGLPSLIASFMGAFLLSGLSNTEALYFYQIGTKLCEITLLKLVIAFILAFFALFEIVPRLAGLSFNQRYLVLGGLLSGFFGGISGNQGALRSAFLIRSNLSKEAFIGTGVVIACMVDVARLSVYSQNSLNIKGEFNFLLLSAATLSAFFGAFIGSRLIKKVTIKSFQVIVAVALLIFSVLLGMGII